MSRAGALKLVLAVVGALFVASLYPLVLFIRQAPALSMLFSLYVPLGIFLLSAVRNPANHRSLIAFTAWSSIAHAVVMGLQPLRDWVSRGELAGVVLLLVIGAALMVLAPGGRDVDTP